MTNLVGERNVGGLGKCVTCQISEFYFLCFCFFLACPGRIFNDLFANMRVSEQECAFWKS